MELNEVLNSKVYVKEDSPIRFKAPSEYLNPFIDLFGGNVNFRVNACDPVINANEDASKNVAYPRILVEGIIGTDLIPGFKSVIGFIYALDPKLPIMKVYSGENVSACMNLTIFNAENLFYQDMLMPLENMYLKAKEFIDNKMRTIEAFSRVLQNLQNAYYTEAELNEKLGYLLRYAPKQLGTTPIVSAVKLLNDNSSSYYVNPNGEFRCNAWNLYNAVTHGISGGNDFLWKPNKTVELSKLFLN